MKIDDYLQKLRENVDNAVSLADSDTRDVASRVASSLEPSVRLALLDAIADATTEIDGRLSTADVSMTLKQGDPSFVIEERGITVEQLASYANADEHDDDPETADEDEFDDEVDEDELVRFSLRIPKWAKDKVDRRAERDGLSTNAYLSELIIAHVAGRRGRRDFGGGPGGFGPGGFGPGGPGGAGGAGLGSGGAGFGGPFGRGFGSGLINPDVIGELGRMFADTFGEGERGARGPRGGPGGRGRGGSGGRGRGGHGGSDRHGGDRGDRGYDGPHGRRGERPDDSEPRDPSDGDDTETTD